MKKLNSLNIARLNNLEFGQHTKSIYTNIVEREQPATPIVDMILVQYLTDLNVKNLAYDKAIVQIIKSDETAKIVQADRIRDKALIAIQRYLAVFEFATEPELTTSYESLHTLFSYYKGLQYMNLEEESNGIDNLIDDLQSDRYSVSVDILGMFSYMEQLQTANDNFKTIFNTRTQEQSFKEVFDVKQLRSELKTSYEKMIYYVVTMSTAKDTPEFNETLSVINTVRKYYSDMLARRKSEAETTV